MRVNPNSDPLDGKSIPSRSPLREVHPDQDKVVLSGTEMVERALGQPLANRSEKVAKAKALLEDPSYPPDVLLTQIATLFANQVSASK